MWTLFLCCGERDLGVWTKLRRQLPYKDAVYPPWHVDGVVARSKLWLWIGVLLDFGHGLVV